MTETRPVTLVTGASAGIGMALARVFAAKGHEIVLLARRALELKSLADEIEAKRQKRPHLLALDLLRPDASARIEKELHDRGLEMEFVVNNAGFGLMGPAADLDLASELAMIDLNVRTLTDLSLRFVDMLERRHGGILNVASIASFLPGPGMAVYHATKAYVLSFSEALHHELKGRGVRVSCLCPGPVQTEFQARAGIPPGYFPSMLARSAEKVAVLGYEGLMRNKRVVVPGTENKVTTFLPRLLPRSLVLRMVRSSRGSATKTKT